MTVPSSESSASNSAEKYPELRFAETTEFNSVLTALWADKAERENMDALTNIGENTDLLNAASRMLAASARDPTKSPRLTEQQMQRDFFSFYMALAKMVQARDYSEDRSDVTIDFSIQATAYYLVLMRKLALVGFQANAANEQRILHMSAVTKDGIDEALHPIDADPNTNFGAH